MRKRRASILAASVVAGLACAHGGGNRAAPTTPRERLEQVLASLPTCPSSEDAFTVAEATSLTLRGKRVRVRGHLVYEPFCTAMACQRACCNKCRGSWGLGVLGEGAPDPL